MKSDRTIHSSKCIKFLIVALFCFMISPTLSHAFPGGKITSFSADQVVLSPNGKVLKTMKFYTTPLAFRVEMSLGGSQGVPQSKLIVLGFEKQNKQFMYNLDKRIYFESTLDAAPMLLKLKLYKGVDSAEIIGKEKVSGYSCVKKEVTLNVPMMGIENSTNVTIWESDKFEFPLRTQTKGGPIGEFRNIDTSVPPKKLFRRQTGYKRVHTLMEVMGIDFAAMVKDASEEDEADEDEENNVDESEESGQKRIEDITVGEIMAGLKEIMGEDASPEFMESVTHSMHTAKQTNFDKGAAVGIWAVIPKHPGDKVGQEVKTPHAYQVVMGTNAPLKEIFNFYEKNLMPQGWEDKGMYVQDGMGAFNLWSDQHRLVISWAENPGMDGNYKFFYSLQLTEIIE